MFGSKINSSNSDHFALNDRPLLSDSPSYLSSKNKADQLASSDFDNLGSSPNSNSNFTKIIDQPSKFKPKPDSGLRVITYDS